MLAIQLSKEPCSRRLCNSATVRLATAGTVAANMSLLRSACWSEDDLGRVHNKSRICPARATKHGSDSRPEHCCREMTTAVHAAGKSGSSRPA